jgi:nucleotide-binding universal stress UspA family protein
MSAAAPASTSTRPSTPPPLSTAGVLVATDFSPSAAHAARRAAEVARAHRVPLALLHVLPGGPLAELRRWLASEAAAAAGGAEQAVRAAAESELQALAAALKGAGDPPPALSTEVAEGGFVEVVEARVRALAASLVCIGVRGSGALRRLVLGSSAERLLRQLSVPLLVVRNASQGPYQRVLAAVDFSDWSLPALRAGLALAPQAEWVLIAVINVPFEDKLRLAGVDEPAIDRYRRDAHAEAAQRLQSLAASAGLQAGRWRAVITDGEPWQRIVVQQQEIGCDLVVMGKRGRSAAAELFLGSVTRLVLAEGSADVLVSPAHAAAGEPVAA